MTATMQGLTFDIPSSVEAARKQYDQWLIRLKAFAEKLGDPVLLFAVEEGETDLIVKWLENMLQTDTARDGFVELARAAIGGDFSNETTRLTVARLTAEYRPFQQIRDFLEELELINDRIELG